MRPSRKEDVLMLDTFSQRSFKNFRFYSSSEISSLLIIILHCARFALATKNI